MDFLGNNERQRAVKTKHLRLPAYKAALGRFGNDLIKKEGSQFFHYSAQFSPTDDAEAWYGAIVIRSTAEPPVTLQEL